MSQQHKELSGLDIKIPWNSTACYIVAYSVDRTKQILLSLDTYTEESWHALLESAGESFDELFNPGPDKTAPEKAVEIYWLMPWSWLSEKTKKEFYDMVNGRVVFRVKNQAHVPLEDPPLVHGAEFLIRGAPNPMISIGVKPVNLSLLEFHA